LLRKILLDVGKSDSSADQGHYIPRTKQIFCEDVFSETPRFEKDIGVLVKTDWLIGDRVFCDVGVSIY